MHCSVRSDTFVEAGTRKDFAPEERYISAFAPLERDPSLVPDDTNMSLLTERDPFGSRFYKHIAPNGAKPFFCELIDPVFDSLLTRPSDLCSSFDAPRAKPYH
jgi:hypothetical protein